MITKPLVLPSVVMGIVFCMGMPAGADAAPAAPGSACGLQLREGWIRQPPMATMPMAAGFGTLHNSCEDAVTLVGVRSNELKEVSLHETTLVDGISRMREVSQVAVPGKGEVVLKPGGLHLMLVRDDRALQQGQRVPVQLVLAGGAVVSGELEVRKDAR